MINKFLDYVEIKTKITSTFAFLMTIGVLMYQKQAMDWKATFIFFLSMFIFDLATTAINNYIDTKTNHQQLQFDRQTALYIIYVLVAISTLLGIYLVYLTDILILFIGGLCFICGVFYTYGPVPISRIPLGEILSGVFYGFFIPFILIYVNTLNTTLISYDYVKGIVMFELNIINFLYLILLSIPLMCCTGNIMLANNICDLEKDIQVNRYTLPFYVGKKALYIFSGLFYLPYIAIITMVILKVLSPLCLLMILTLFPVQRNINIFYKKQDKGKTFIVAIKNYIYIVGTTTALIFISLFI